MLLMFRKTFNNKNNPSRTNVFEELIKLMNKHWKNFWNNLNEADDKITFNFNRRYIKLEQEYNYKI